MTIRRLTHNCEDIVREQTIPLQKKSPMKKYTLPFIQSKSILPFVKLTSPEGKEIYALVDSGSESTLINKSFKKDYPGIIQSSTVIGKTKMTGFAGEKEMVLLQAEAKVPMLTDKGEASSIEFKGYVDDLTTLSSHVSKIYGVEWSFSILIGSDPLCSLKAKIDYSNNALVLFVSSKR